MKTEHFFQTMSDGIEIAVNRWIPEGEIKGIIQLSHGMTEYSMRYDTFARIMAQEGFVLNAHDHRGHGKTAERAEERGTGTFGYLADKDGFQKVVEDLHEVTEQVKKDYPGIPVMLIGHSFGSFVAQSFIENYGNTIFACILLGTAGPRLSLTRAGRFIISLYEGFRGKKFRSAAINRMTFGPYNSRIRHASHVHDWLSRDTELVEKYEADPMCIFIPTLGFFYDMLDGLCTIHTAENMKKIPSTLPVCLMCGDADPVGDYSRTVRNLYDVYCKNGMKNVRLKIYHGARHELLNETNRDEVIKDILDWIRLPEFRFPCS